MQRPNDWIAMLTMQPMRNWGFCTAGKRKDAATDKHWPTVLSMPREVARWLWLPVLDDCHAGLSVLPRVALTDNNRNVGVAGGYNTAHCKVPARELGLRCVHCWNGEEDSPPDNAEHEGHHGGDSTALHPVRVGSKKKHKDEGNSVGRNSHELRASRRREAKALDNGGKETTDRTQGEVHARVPGVRVVDSKRT